MHRIFWISTFASVFCCLVCNAQDTISVEYVAKHSHEFAIVGGKIVGSGSAFMKRELQGAQFVLIGEQHGMARISELTSAIISEMASAGCKHMCLETGRSSMKIASELIAKGNLHNQLYEFYTKYYNATGDVPIPFIDGVEDVQFIQAAIDHDFQFFGIDQEYFGSTLLLLDELLERDRNSSTIAAHRTAADFVIAQHQRILNTDADDLHQALVSSEEIANFLKALDRSDPTIAAIISDMHASWEIYNLYSSNLNQNLEKRATLMKGLFVESYKQAELKTPLPKMLIKMGAWHTMRGVTYNSVYDIGNLVHELAAFNGTKDLSMSFLTRYMLDDEEPDGYFDNSEGDSSWLKAHRPLMGQGLKEKWVAIDFRTMKDDIINRQIWCYPGIKAMMYDVDLVLIPPMDHYIKPNYQTE